MTSDLDDSYPQGELRRETEGAGGVSRKECREQRLPTEVERLPLKEPDVPHSMPRPRLPVSVPGDLPRPPEYRAAPVVWHGITWQDVPGHDEQTQKLNFSLLRRGMLKGHAKCLSLEGEALKAELQKLSARNRSNSRKGSLRRRGAPQPPRFPLPPPRFPEPPPRHQYPS